MSIELATAAVLGSQLLEAKYHVKDDFLLVQKIIRSALPFLWNVRRGRASFWYTFEKSALKYPNNVCISFPRPKKNPPPIKVDSDGFKVYDDQFEVETFTYKEFYNMILRFSYILKNDYGVTADQTIAIDCMNKPLFILLWLSLWNIGALPSFLNFNTRDKALVHCLKIAEVSQVFIDPDCMEPIKSTESQIYEELPNIKLHYLNETELFKTLRDPSIPKYRAPDNTRRVNDKDFDPSALIYTSGTTGLPKAGIMSWRKAFMAASFFGYIMKINKKSNVLTAMPLYHSTAAMLAVCPTFLIGGCVSLSQKFLATSFWTQAKLVNASHVQYVGETCRYLLNTKYHPDQKLHNVRIAYGNGLRPDIWKEFKSRFNIDGVGEFYAATESPIALTNLQFGDFGVGACRKYGSIISNVLSLEQVIVKMDPDDQEEIWRDPSSGLCVKAQPNEPGELLMKILNAEKIEESFQGYYGNKSATSKKVIRDVFSKGDAWFRTGDLLRMDQDKLLYFVDRLGDTFRWKSENVSASEVENELMGSGSIVQSVVVGVQIPNHEGRAGFAVLEPKDGLDTSEILSKVHKHVVNTLPKYAVPQFLKIGKIEASHNNKVPKNLYKKQKLPKGDSGDETIYWFNQDGYKELTNQDWAKISNGQAKL